MTESTKHICHECGGRIEYPKHAFGQSVNCPHCGQETTLGEIYPSAPIAHRTPLSAPPPPPPLPRAGAGAAAGNLGSHPDSVADAKALNRIAHANSLKPAAKTQSFSAGKIGGIASGVLFAIWLLLQLGAPVWNTYLQTDKAAIDLVKKSMLETWSSAPELKKPIEILQFNLAPGRSDSRSGTALVTLGGQAETIHFKVKITRSFGRDLQVEWQILDEKVDSATRQPESAASSPAPQQAQMIAPQGDANANAPFYPSEAKIAVNLMELIESTEDMVRERWNNGIKNEVGGLAQLEMIRDQIVPLVRDTKARIEQFRPASVKLQPVKSAMLELVQHDFSSWIAINNAAAIGNWPAARAGFDRMEVDRKVYARKLNAAVQSSTNK